MGIILGKTPVCTEWKQCLRAREGLILGLGGSQLHPRPWVSCLPGLGFWGPHMVTTPPCSLRTVRLPILVLPPAPGTLAQGPHVPHNQIYLY